MLDGGGFSAESAEGNPFGGDGMAAPSILPAGEGTWQPPGVKQVS